MKVCSVCLRCYEDEILSCSKENHGSLSEARPGKREIIPNYQLKFLHKIDEISETYQAVNLDLDQPCVISIISLNHFENNEEIQSAFLEEARLISELEHPQIVRIFDSGKLPDGSLYFVSEFIGAKTLGEFLSESKSFSEISAVSIARQIAESLGAIHAIGVVHRNINPENIFLIFDAENNLSVKIKNIDFGGIKQRFVLSNISNFDVANSLKYFSPEQCADEKTVDFSTDIYSLGIMLYELLAGKTPFDAPDGTEIIHRQINETAMPPKISNFNIRALLTHTLMLSLQKTVVARMKSSDVFARQLRHIEQYATRSFSPAITEKIFNDDRLKNQSKSQTDQIKTQKEESAFLRKAMPSSVIEVLSVDKSKNAFVEQSKSIGILPIAKPTLVEWDQPEDIPTETEIAEIFDREFGDKSPPSRLEFVDEKENFFKPEETNSTQDISASAIENRLKETKSANSYNFDGVRNLISVANKKVFIGGSAVLLIVLIGAFLSWQFSVSKEQSINASQSIIKKTGDVADQKTNNSSVENSEQVNPNSETAVAEIPELPDSKTFSVRENPLSLEKSSQPILKSGNQSSTLDKSVSTNKLALGKKITIDKEEFVSKTKMVKNAFPDVKIIIGAQTSKPVKDDSFSRPRIVKKEKKFASLLIFGISRQLSVSKNKRFKQNLIKLI